jgi:hypothetical protein
MRRSGRLVDLAAVPERIERDVVSCRRSRPRFRSPVLALLAAAGADRLWCSLSRSKGTAVDEDGSQETAAARTGSAAQPDDPPRQAAPAAATKSVRYRVTAAIARATAATRPAAARAGKSLSERWARSWSAKLAAGLTALIVAKGVRYWLGALIFLVASYMLSQWLYKEHKLSVYRPYYFQWLYDHGPRAAYAKYVRLDLIGDREFSAIGQAGKPPTEEMYLAQIISRLAQPDAHANVIAIDFDYGIPASEAHHDEDCTLIDSIHNAVTRGSRVILPTLVVEDESTGTLYRQPDIYQAFGLCTADRPVQPAAACGEPYHTAFDNNERSRIACGYIALPADFARVPTLWHIDDARTLASFALTIARATEPKITENLLTSFHDHHPIGHFMGVDAFRQAGHEFTADSYPSDEVNGATVIIGAAWHTIAENQGPLIDVHNTPAAQMVGAMLHANYVEALLDQRTANAISEKVTTWLELCFGIIAALVVAAAPGWRGLGAFMPLIIAMLVVQWIVLHAFGIYFDALLVLFGLAVHSFIENLFGSHGHAPSAPDATASTAAP